MSIDEILSYLENKSEPVMEADLLKKSFGLDRLPIGAESLFDIHFALYHRLYLARRPLALRGMYLHLDPMRIRLVRYPAMGRCFHYFPESGAFCGSGCSGVYCPDHEDLYRDDRARPSIDMLGDFYINEENISFGKCGLLEKLMNGIVIYAFKKGEIDNALNIFGLTKPSARTIASTYHFLARKYHPDLHDGDDNKMKEINRAYQVLREVFII
ncbi:MAG TPA: DnaJ domain-containing protein [Spirochaetota bacterium]|nr:DnaJ domain-containing protein [Spirochaetota bacterium]